MTTEYSDKDIVKVLVNDRTLQQDRWIYSVRMTHREYNPKKEWTYCDLELSVPDGEGLPQVGERGDLILNCLATMAEPSVGAAYGCKLYSGNKRPLFPLERAGEEGRYVGLIQREEPPMEGEIIFHMGSGLTCYPRFAESVNIDPQKIQDGEWWELVFPHEHSALLFRRCS